MLKKSLLGMILVVLIGTPALGLDKQGGRWWRHPGMAKELNLTEEEKTRLDKAFLDSQRRLIELKANVEKEQLELEVSMEKEPLDEGASMTQFKKLEGARANLSEEQFKFIVEVRKIMGPDRFKQLKGWLKKWKKNRADDMPRGGPGLMKGG